MFEGVDGRDEALDGGLLADEAFVMTLFDLLDGVLAVDLAADAGALLLAALAGVLAGVLDGVLVEDDADLLLAGGVALIGVFESVSEAPVKLNSFMGDTDDLLVAESDLRADVADLLVADGRFLLVDAAAFFLAGVGVLAVDALGLGVPLMGLEALLAGVGVCLAILIIECACVFERYIKRDGVPGNSSLVKQSINQS